MIAMSRLDPSRTSGLRRRFEADAARRLDGLMRLIRESIITNDCFGLATPNATLSAPMSGLQAATVHQFAFERNTTDKVAAFMRWLKQMEAEGILEVTVRHGGSGAIGVAWTDTYISSAYRQGINRALNEMQKAGIQTQMPLADISGRAAVSAAFALPIHADRVGAIYTRTFEDLKTVMDVVNADARRKLIDGLTTKLSTGIAEGRNPMAIASDMVKDVASGLDKIGLNRARLIARTEIIRAHHVATINEYRRADSEMNVKVEVEFKATEDARTCEDCLSLDGKTFTLDEIEGVIPVHPGCRCTVIPITERLTGNSHRRAYGRVA
jgi:SPP1 gp7 family putative phage head morphogenesis protein